MDKYQVQQLVGVLFVLALGGAGAWAIYLRRGGSVAEAMSVAPSVLGGTLLLVLGLTIGGLPLVHGVVAPAMRWAERGDAPSVNLCWSESEDFFDEYVAGSRPPPDCTADFVPDSGPPYYSWLISNRLPLWVLVIPGLLLAGWGMSVISTGLDRIPPRE